MKKKTVSRGGYFGFYFDSLPCLQVSILRKHNDGNDVKDGNIAWEGGVGLLRAF